MHPASYLCARCIYCAPITLGWQMRILSNWTSGDALVSRLPWLWNVLGAIVIGLMLARWTWVLLAPHSISVFPSRPSEPTSHSASLFGTVSASAVASASPAVSKSNIRLVGVYTGKQGFAVIKLDEKKQLGVALGEEFVKGTKLVAVAADHVMLEHDGMRERVELDVKLPSDQSVVVSQGEASRVASVKPGSAVAEKAIQEWDKARQEMQKKPDLFGAR